MKNYSIKIDFERATAHTYTISSNGKEVYYQDGFTSAQQAFDAAQQALKALKYGK